MKKFSVVTLFVTGVLLYVMTGHAEIQEANFDKVSKVLTLKILETSVGNSPYMLVGGCFSVIPRHCVFSAEPISSIGLSGTGTREVRFDFSQPLYRYRPATVGGSFIDSALAAQLKFNTSANSITLQKMLENQGNEIRITILGGQKSSYTFDLNLNSNGP